MSGSFLLDTNIVIGLFANEKTILDQLTTAESVAVPSIVLGELYFGALKSARSADNIARIERFAAASFVLVCDAVTARTYGTIKQQLKTKGRPIPENDIWIAALAMQYGLTLATRDNHFHEVEALLIDSWP